jgi:hypothetical protein
MRVDDTIYIEAPPDLVWAVTTDVERWPEWAPTFTSVTRLDEGPFRMGSAARIKQPLQAEAEWTVTEFAEGRRFAWTTRRAGLQMTGTHEVSPRGSGSRNLLRVEASGAIAVLLWPLLRIAFARSQSTENRGLKARCEALSRGGADEYRLTPP